MNQLRDKMHTKMMETIKNPELKQKLEEKFEQVKKMRKEMQEKRQQMMAKMKEIRKNFRESRQELVVKYKKFIYARLEKRIENMSLARLEKIQSKIDKAVERIKNNTRLTEERKAKIISAIDALKQVIDEKIAKFNAESNDAMKEVSNLLNE
jgi:uncharacterized coiled-coil DUF342 family protein